MLSKLSSGYLSHLDEKQFSARDGGARIFGTVPSAFEPGSHGPEPSGHFSLKPAKLAGFPLKGNF